MIDEIRVQNLALIREASLIPSRGLTVLTGETGAGKTALLSALKLLMGSRASADAVRDGEDGLSVSGRFFGLDGGCDDEVVVTRKVGAEGRSRATLNGAMASVRELAETVAPSVDLCGQFEHQQLMKPATHIATFDAWAGDAVGAARKCYADAYDAAADAAAELQRVKDARDISAAKLDEARFALARIDEANPKEGEYEQLQHDLELAESAEALAMALAATRAALAEDAGALDSLNTAASSLEAVGAIDSELEALAESLREAGYILEDVSGQVRDYLDKLDFDPSELAQQQERFSLLQGLVRSFGPRMEDVLERRAQAAEVVSLAGDSGKRLEEAQRALDEAEEQLAQAADALDAARAAAAPQFASEVSAVMHRLQMADSQLVCAQERQPRDAWTKAGPSSFTFMYCPTADSHPRPLARIASGGEVSRVMLAMKVVLGNRDAVSTLVFDEVDAGVGGATALALADEIAHLAETHQVIVITHLAQVAVCADVHYVVKRDGAQTALSQISGEQREREIARMLSGSITEASLAHARELLAG